MKAKDLQTFEQLLNDRKIQLQKNIASFADEQAGAQKDDLKDEGDLASASGGAVITDAIIMQQKKELEEIEYAFKKICKCAYQLYRMRQPFGISKKTVK